MDVTEWIVQYVKHKDLLKKELEGFEVLEDKVEFQYEDRDHDYFICKTLQPDDLEIDSEAESITLVCLNEEENLDFLIDHWDELKEKEDLTIIFVNLEANTKWIIRPYTHNKVADLENLEEGLKTMFEQVAPE